MKGSIIDKVVTLRTRFDEWLPQSVTFENILYFAYLAYLVGIIVYIFDYVSAGEEERSVRKGMRAFGNVIGFVASLYVLVFLVVFLFPQSRFTLFLQEILNAHPAYPVGAFLILGCVAGITACVAVILDMWRKKR